MVGGITGVEDVSWKRTGDLGRVGEEVVQRLRKDDDDDGGERLGVVGDDEGAMKCCLCFQTCMLRQECSSPQKIAANADR